MTIRAALSALTLSACMTAGAMTLGYEYDITREKVPTHETICRVIDIIGRLGYTQLHLYFKDNFAYPGHEAIWRDRGHLTPGEVRELDAYCAKRGIMLVPYQSSFGHLEPWFEHAEYLKYAECPGGSRYYNAKFKREMRTSALCPTDPAALGFMTGLFDVLFPCFSSPYVNLGCDEVWDLYAENGRSAAEVAEKGVGEVYFGFIMKLRDAAKARGKTMMFWSDIVFRHPEFVPRLPHDVVALEWNYEADGPYAERTAALKRAGCRYYVCPGTSSWCSYFGRHDNMKANVKNAFTNGTANGAEGLLLTDWGDAGYPQPWLVSLPALVYTAALVKEGRTLDDGEIAARVDAICGCRVGESLIAAGNAYLALKKRGNGTELFWLCYSPTTYKMPEGMTAGNFRQAVARLRAAQKMRDLSGASAWVADDCALSDLLVDFAERRVYGETRSLAEVYAGRYKALWNRQNRPQGVEKSIERVFGPLGGGM